MPDLADEAQDYIEQMMAFRVREIAGQPVGESLGQCEDCGNDIPGLRREKVPGVRTCVGCQEIREFSARMNDGRERGL